MVDLYKELGVDAGKKDVRAAVEGKIDNEFPGAFVNIIRDPFDPTIAVTQHNDGDGSKIIERILVFLETADESVLDGQADDSFEMNMGDISASGFGTGLTTLTDILNIKDIPKKVPKKIIMRRIFNRYAELRDMYNWHGFTIRFMGGETADLPDQIKNAVGDACVNSRTKVENIIRGNVQDGDRIHGFASFGKAIWEKRYNSGIMSNGHTLGRTYTAWEGYTEKYPFLLRDGGAFKGRYKIGEGDDLIPQMSVSDAMICPTRHWGLFIKLLVEKLKKYGLFHMLHGISMNTGGGGTKIGHVGKDILYRKAMPLPPGLFQLIQRESGSSWRNMFRDFNCGIGLDIIAESHPDFVDVMEEISQDTQIMLFPNLGICESRTGKGNKVILDTPYGLFDDYNKD